jgi:hypothetical protein
MTENTTSGYDSGVDCCEQPVSDEPSNENNKLEAPKATGVTNNGISVSKFYSSVADHLIEPKITQESHTVIHQKTLTSPSNKHLKHTRRKKRKHLFTARRRKSRPGHPLQSCEQTQRAREQNSSEGESFSDIHGVDISLGTRELALNSQQLLNNTRSPEMDTQHEIVDVTHHVNDDVLHASHECGNVNVESGKHIPMHVEDCTNIAAAESNHVLFEVNNGEVDECKISHASNMMFSNSHVDTVKDNVTCDNDYAATRILGNCNV